VWVIIITGDTPVEVGKVTITDAGGRLTGDLALETWDG